MKSIFKKLYFFDLDLLPKYSSEQRRVQRLLIINYFFVFAIPVFIVNDLVLAMLRIQPYTFEKFPVLVIWLIFIIALYLTKKKRYLPSKLIIIFSPLMLLTTYSLTGYIIGEHFLWQPIMLLGMSIIPFLVLDVKKEKTWLLIAFLSFLAYVIFHDKILIFGAHDTFRDVFNKLNTTPFIYDAVRIIIFLFITFIIYYSVRINDHQQLINEKINESLVQTSDYLENVNAELQAQRNAINNSGSLLITDEHQNIVSANDNFLTLSGYLLTELKGENANFLISEYHDEAFLQAMKKTVESGEVWRGELKNNQKGGNYFWTQTAISPIYNQDKKQKGYLIIMFNITKLKDDEERLERLNFEKDRILYAVAHDLKNPLLNFKSLLDMMKAGIVKKEDEHEVFRLMTKDCDHSTSLISELLEIGRLEDEKFVLEKEVVNLNLFLEKSLDQFEQTILKKRLKFTKIFEKNLKQIKINEKEFIRVIYNLISNAIKFTPAGGEIKIITKTVSDDKISIEISDTGIGISKELLPIIFDKFSKARRKGIEGEKSTGLGMWIVKHIIKLHEGEISVRSQENKGTTFTIQLPG